MDWLVGDELMRQWEEASKDEEEDNSEENRRQKATSGELARFLVAQAHMKKKAANK